jgi:hypothetical protein
MLVIKRSQRLGLVAHACDLSYSVGGDPEEWSVVQGQHGHNVS